MAIKILGGLALENLASDKPMILEKIETQKVLYEEGITAGVQILAGHDCTNQLPIDVLLQRVREVGIPYLVHAPHEGRGLDLEPIPVGCLASSGRNPFDCDIGSDRGIAPRGMSLPRSSQRGFRRC